MGFLDVLGFSDFVARNGHTTVTSVYDQLLTTLLTISLPGAKARTQDQGTSEAGATADLSNVKVHALLVSDSIVFYSDRADPDGFLHTLIAVQRSLCYGFYFGLPLRGAISVGPLTHRSLEWQSGGVVMAQALYGQALVDAKRLEECQQWSGAIVDRRAMELIDQYLTPSQGSAALVSQNFLARYEVPVKESGQLLTREEWAVAWPWGNGNNPADRPPNDMVRGSFSMYGKNPAKAERKIRRTLEFLDELRPEGRRE